MVNNIPIFSNPIQNVPPQSDEIEISLFGPGIGECIVIHLGNNEWLIVDSCIDHSTKEAVPLQYLDQLGINAEEAVKLFVISHWHTDHIRGASRIAHHCKNAIICFSDVLISEEFLALVSAFSGLEHTVLIDRENNGTREISSIIKLIKKRCENNESKQSPFLLISADRRIHQIHNPHLLTEIWSLSPSSQSKLNSLSEIAQLLPKESDDEIRRVVPRPEKNHNSIVLWVKIGNHFNILLGSDLEETSDPLTGWSIILNSSGRPLGFSRVFKIPHHGSHNGHSDNVWQYMVEKDAIGILTSKIGGQSDLPKPSDIKRLQGYTSNLFCTSVPKVKKQKRDRTVEKTIKGIMKKVIPLNGEVGQIQIRMKVDSISVNLKEPAVKI